MSKNEKSVVYIVDKDYKLIYINEEGRKRIPDNVLGKRCYKALCGFDNPCSKCPLIFKNDNNDLFYNESYDGWYSMTSSIIEVPNKGNCNLITVTPFKDATKFLDDHIDSSNNFDEIIEIDLDNKTYKIFASDDNTLNRTMGNIVDFKDMLLNKYIDISETDRFNLFWDYERIKKSILQCIDSRSVFNLIDTSIYNWMSIRLVPIGNTDSKAYCFIKFHKKNNTDITNSEDNTLTGLLSSQAFTQKVMNMIENADCEYSLICLDIEHFKMFNEWYGHNVGDILLSDIGSVLKSIDEEIGSISGYFGADNFAILVPNDKKNIDEITTNLMLYIEGHNQSSGFLPAFGIIEIKNKDLDFSQLYDRAVIAKTHAKGNYTNRICYFNEEMLIQMENEHLIHIDVQRALKDEEFTFYLQPQCNMSTGKIFAAEALVRWFHKDKGMVPPYKFIPVLEKSGGISELDKYIWNKVAKWQRSVIDRGITPVPVSVNVSRADLYYMDIVEYFISLVEKYEISPALIEIEITESVYIDGYDKLQGIVDKLRDYGFKVLMDDFGSGYSSLNMLKNISIDTLKLDMKFLDLNAKNNEKGINILESVVNMIKTMNLPIITEGVENDMQRCALLDMGCLYAQGYLFYKPMSISDFESLLVNSELTDYTGIQIKRVEQLQLREILNENIYSDTLVNNILGAVAFFDYHDGKVEISHINEGYYRLFGNVCMNDPNYRTNIMDYFVLDDHQAIKEGFEYAYHNVLRGANVELRYKHEDGIIWVHARLFYLNKETKPGHRLYYCSFVNVTSKYDAENQLYLLNKKLKTTIKLENINSWEINFANNSLILFTCEENGPLSGMVPTDTNQKRIVLPFPECVLNNDLIPDKYVSLIKTYLNRYIDGTYQDKCVLEIPFVIDDQYTWYRIIGSPLYDSNGILKVCVGSYKNITDIVKIREEDREKTKSIEILRESSIFSMNVNITQNIIYDMTGELSFNDTMLMSERSFSSFHYAAINDSILESDKEKFYNIVNRSNLEQYYKNNQCLVSFEYRRLLNGKPVWRKFSIYLQQATEDDDLFGYFFVSDIEAFKNKRSQIINFSGVFEDAACGVIRYDRDTNEIIAVNDEFAKILGYENKSEIKDNFHNGVVDKVYEDDKRIIYEVSKGLINVGDSQNVEYRVIVDGQMKYLLCNMSLFFDRGRFIIQRNIIDNTEEKKLEISMHKETSFRESNINAMKTINSSNESRALLMGINQLFKAFYYCNMTDNTFKIMKYARGLSGILENSDTYDELIENYCKNYVHSDDIETLKLLASRSYIKKNVTRYNNRFCVTYRRRINNEYRWFKLDIIGSYYDFNNIVENIIFAVSDINDEITKESQFKNQLNHYKELLFSATTDVYEKVIYVNLKNLHASRLYFIDGTLKEKQYSYKWDRICEFLIDEASLEYRKSLHDLINSETLRALEVGSSITLRYKGKQQYDGDSWHSINVRIININGVKMATLFFIDITDDVVAFNDIKNVAEHDALTNLYNRNKLDSLIENEYNYLTSCAVVFVDLNGLKNVNDTLGHNEGDKLITGVSRSIKAIENEMIHGFRYGGDEFLIIICNKTIEEVNKVIDGWALELKNVNSNLDLELSVSYGISYSDDNIDVEGLIDQADEEMYKNKKDIVIIPNSL